MNRYTKSTVEYTYQWTTYQVDVFQIYLGSSKELRDLEYKVWI